MTLKAIVTEAEKLSREERWELVEELMRMDGGAPPDVALTPTQAADLERRLDEARRGKDDLIPGDQAVKLMQELR
jgi:putative addiction module component (TIGR02574 family)